MKTEWLIKNSCRRLVMFFAGWGMDPRPFRHITSEDTDVFMFFDYRDGEADIVDVCCGYESINLIAWSLGVIAAELFCQKHQLKLDRALAINGTPYPAHDEFGIPAEVFDGTLGSLNEDNLQKFYRRMCRAPEVLEIFLAKAPERDIDSLADELRVLRSLVPPDKTVFKNALVSSADRIVPPANQLACWNKLGVSARKISGPHYPFNRYASWEGLMDECNEHR